MSSITKTPPSETDTGHQTLSRPTQSVGQPPTRFGGEAVIQEPVSFYQYDDMGEDEEVEAFRALSFMRLRSELDDEPDFDPSI